MSVNKEKQKWIAYRVKKSNKKKDVPQPGWLTPTIYEIQYRSWKHGCDEPYYGKKRQSENNIRFYMSLYFSVNLSFISP